MQLYKNKAGLYDKFIAVTGRDCKSTIAVITKYINKNDSILELGAGTGTCSLLLKNKGYSVVCSDVNSEILELARKKTGLECIKLDMRSFVVKKKFDVILSLFNTLTYNQSLTDLKNNFSSCFKALNVSGRFIIEVTNPEILLSSGKDFTHLWELDTNTWIIQIDEIKVPKLVHRFVFINPITKETFTDVHDTTIFTSKEIVDILQSVGFKNVISVIKNNTSYFIANK